MKTQIRALVLVLAIATISTACTTRQGTFTVLSTKNTEISRIDLKRVQFSRNREGSDGRLWFLIIPLSSRPTIEEASDRCLEIGQGDFMTSAVVYRSFWSVLLFSYDSWTVKGDVGNSLSTGAADIKDRKEN